VSTMAIECWECGCTVCQCSCAPKATEVEWTGPRVRVFLAGPSREAERVRKYAARLEALHPGVHIVNRWFEYAETWAGKDAEMTKEAQAVIARESELDLECAPIVWVFWPKEVSHGAAYEFGYARGHAQGLGLTVVVSGAASSGCVYTSLASYRDASDEVTYHRVAQLLNSSLSVKGQ
jgi:hypothetical protein